MRHVSPPGQHIGVVELDIGVEPHRRRYHNAIDMARALGLQQPKVAILSVTEGDDKPIKYPDMFAAADPEPDALERSASSESGASVDPALEADVASDRRRDVLAHDEHHRRHERRLVHRARRCGLGALHVQGDQVGRGGV